MGLISIYFFTKALGEEKGKIPLTKERTENKHYKLLKM
jgi:hypothetical protein